MSLQGFAINKEVSFLFLEDAPFFLRKKVPSKCRAPKFEMHPTSLSRAQQHRFDQTTIKGDLRPDVTDHEQHPLCLCYNGTEILQMGLNSLSFMLGVLQARLENKGTFEKVIDGC